MMKFSILFVAFITTVSSICFASESHINAKLVNYTLGRFEHNYFLIIPDNILDYEYLGHYPFTAFMLLRHYDEEKISKLTVNELKTGSLGSSISCCAGSEYYDVLKFAKIKGLEKVAADLETLDEFGITERKNEILSTLLECFAKYKEDYERYLHGTNGCYVIRKGKFRLFAGNQLKEYNDNVKTNERKNPFAFYERININDYDFDKKLITLKILSPYSKISSNGWEYHYIRRFINKYQNQKYRSNPTFYQKDFPIEIKVPMTIDDAKKLFAEKDEVYSETILTVTPEQGYFGYPGAAFFVMTSSFNIKKITKNYYKRRNWSGVEKMFIGGPVLTIVLKSNDKHPFY